MVLAVNARYLHDARVGGYNRYTICLLRALQNHAEVELRLVADARFPVDATYQSLIRGEVIHLRAPRGILWEQWALPRYLRHRRPTVFHAPAEAGLPLLKVCPYVLTYHGIPEESLRGHGMQHGNGEPPPADFADTVLVRLRGEALRNLYLALADLVITPSHHTKTELERLLGVPPERIRVVRQAPDEAFGRPVLPHAASQLRERHGIPERFLLFVGGPDPHKNVSGLLRAASPLLLGDRRTALVLAGLRDGRDRYRADARRLGLLEPRHVLFLDELSDADLATLYSSASLFTTLSWHEGFCLPVVEAMACGAAVVASNRGAIPEVLGNGGLLVDPRRPYQVTETLRQVLENPALQEDLRRRALARARDFSWDRAAQETLAVYREVAPRHDD